MNAIPRDQDQWNILERYKSKKNTVFKIEFEGTEYIVKRYSKEFRGGMETELNILEDCEKQGITVPSIVDSWDDILIMECIDGINCKVLFDSGDEEQREDVVSGIAEWLSRFHDRFAHERRRGDCILANFILYGDDIYGIDFEGSEEGNYLRDLGDLCMSILRMRPAFTQDRFDTTWEFLDEYFSRSSMDKMDITDQLVASLNHYSRYSSMGDLMREWAEKIRKNGLEGISQR